MKAHYKEAQKREAVLDITRANLKMFLLALKESEGFGKDRLYRVLMKFCDLVDETSYDNEEMLMIDSIIEKVMGKDFILSIGREKLDFEFK